MPKIRNGEAIMGDCLEEMKKIPDGSIDCIITDPPYRVISWWNKCKDWRNFVFNENDWKLFKHNNINIWDYIGELFRVLKDQSHCYIMTNNMNLENFLTEIRIAWFWFHNLLVWRKNTKNANRWYMKEIEYIIFCRKWKAKTINNCWYWQVLEFSNPRNKLHPTEKPVELIRVLVENSTKEWDIILDPFSWSNSLWLACENTNRKWICIEKDENYFNIWLNRLWQLSQ